MDIGLIRSYADKPWRSLETYQLIEESLRERWKVDSISTKDPDVLHDFLVDQNNGDGIFAFNLAEYLDEETKSYFLPELLENWEVPHLGSNSQAVEIGLDKAWTKDLLMQNQIPTAKYFSTRHFSLKTIETAAEIGYPLIVKPVHEGGHIGIGDDSIVYDADDLETAVLKVVEDYEQPAIVEEFISGPEMREFSVGILEGKVKTFTPVEIDYDAMDVDVEILSFEAAQKDQEQIKLVDDDEISKVILDLSERVFDVVGASDYSRIDLRMNETGTYVLEINVMPGLGPHSFLPEAARDILGMDYKQFIQKLAENSMARNLS